MMFQSVLAAAVLSGAPLGGGDLAPRWRADAGAYVIDCSSGDYDRARCQAPFGFVIRDVEIERVRSEAECKYGSTWGFDSNAVWVDDGCRATFILYGSEHGGPNPGPGPGGPWGDRTITVECRSYAGARSTCPVSGRIESASVEQSLGPRACVQGRSWGWNASAVWVDDSCGARFRVTLAAGGWDPGPYPPGGDGRARDAIAACAVYAVDDAQRRGEWSAMFTAEPRTDRAHGPGWVVTGPVRSHGPSGFRVRDVRCTYRGGRVVDFERY